MKITSENWEEEFDGRFNHFNDLANEEKKICDYICNKSYGLEDVKSFISSLIQAVIKDVVGEEWDGYDYRAFVNGDLDKNELTNFLNGHKKHRQEVIERGASWIKKI